MATAPFAAPLGTPRFKWWDNSGAPLASGQVLIQQAGTTTNDTSYPTYNDGIAGTNNNANPLILDSNGEASIFLQAGRLYKITVKTPVAVGGATLYTMDSFNPAAGYPAATANAPFVSEWTVELNSILFLSGTSFRVNGVDVAGTYHPGRRVRTMNSVGFVYGTVVNSSFAAGSTIINVITDNAPLDAGLSQAAYGIVSYVNPSYLDPRTCLIVTKNGDQGPGFAGATKVAGWTVEKDASQEWFPANNRWVARYPGNYRISFALFVKDTAASQGFNLYVAKNGTTSTPRLAQYTGITPLVATVNVYTRDMALIAGDYIEMWLLCSANTTVVATETCMSIERLP